MTRPFSELVALMSETEVGPSQDKLDRLTEKMREARDLKAEIVELEERVKSRKKVFNDITQRDLPDMMNETSQGFLRLEAEGNHPAFTFNLLPFYKANISNEEDNAPLAYQWLDDHGEGDIIKRTVTASLGRDSEALQQKLLEFLNENGVDADVKFGVPWNTLTAWLKERHAQYLRQCMSPDVDPDDVIEIPDLDLFGATIGQIVAIKEAKI